MYTDNVMSIVYSKVLQKKNLTEISDGIQTHGLLKILEVAVFRSERSFQISRVRIVPDLGPFIRMTQKLVKLTQKPSQNIVFNQFPGQPDPERGKGP